MYTIWARGGGIGGWNTPDLTCEISQRGCWCVLQGKTGWNHNGSVRRDVRKTSQRPLPTDTFLVRVCYRFWLMSFRCWPTSRLVARSVEITSRVGAKAKMCWYCYPSPETEADVPEYNTPCRTIPIPERASNAARSSMEIEIEFTERGRNDQGHST